MQVLVQDISNYGVYDPLLLSSKTVSSTWPAPSDHQNSLLVQEDLPTSALQDQVPAARMVFPSFDGDDVRT